MPDRERVAEDGAAAGQLVEVRRFVRAADDVVEVLVLHDHDDDVVKLRQARGGPGNGRGGGRERRHRAYRDNGSGQGDPRSHYSTVTPKRRGLWLSAVGEQS